MRISGVVALACFAVLGLAAADESSASIRQLTQIPAQTLGTALEQLAKDRNLQVVYVSEEVGAFRTEGAVGTFTADEALRQLLKGTGLTFRYLDEKTVTIVAASTQPSSRNSSSPSASSPSVQPPSGQIQPQAPSFWDRLHLAQLNEPNPSTSSTINSAKSASGASSNAGQLEEVVVTAQKRQERLIDTPQSVSVLTPADFAKLAATKFSDFANTVPGLNYQTSGAGFSDISLRGVTSGFDISPTVGIYVDEVPYGASTTFGFGAQIALDVGLFDIERIEVLRGPQGTLYGASTMGGLLKYVTRPPDLTNFGGDAQAGVSGTAHGSANYDVAAAVNMPIAPGRLAVRASGFESHDGGYIYDNARNEKNVNRGDIYGGRLDLLFTPTDALSVRLTGFSQDVSRDGEPTADYTFAGAMPYGSLNQNRKLGEPFDERFELVSATVAYDFGPTTLTSISSYQTLYQENVWDISAVYVPLLHAALGRSYGAVGSPDSVTTNKFTEEVRLTGQRIGPLEWVVGGFYTHESSLGFESFTLYSADGIPQPNDLFYYRSPSKYEETAAFGDVTWHLTDRLSATGGVRYAHDDQTFHQFAYGLFIGSLPIEHSYEHVLTYLGDMRYQVSENQSVYLRYATGYRPGGPNLAANDPVTGRPLGPATFQPDQLKSYEVGYKAETDDRRLAFDVSAYDIDWDNIQITAIRHGFAFRANAPGGARVEGMELTVNANPISHLSLTGAFAYEHAYMRQGNADLGSTTGERLPNVPRFTAAVNADYILSEIGIRPSVGATARYVGSRDASFDLSAGFPQYRLPSYTTVDLRTGCTVGWAKLQLYIHNISDERGQLSDMYPQFGARIAIIQPRTVGVNVSTEF